MSKKDNENKNFQKFLLTIGSFYTNKNSEANTLKSIIKAFFNDDKYSEIKKKNIIQYEFIHKILDEDGNKNEYKINFIEINLKNYINDEFIDCYIIFFDLENKDSLGELDKILNFIKKINLNEKRIYLINVFNNEKNIKEDLTEENIKKYFDKNNINNYDISTIDLTASNSELTKIIDSILLETFDEKLSNDKNNKNKFNDEFYEGDPGKSGCFIL